jgi:hypothetical protein
LLSSRVRQWRIRRILFRWESGRRGSGPSADAVPQVVPAKPDAGAEEHRDNCTQDVGSQLRSGHGQWRLQEGQAFRIFGERTVRRACPSLWVTNPNPMVEERCAKRGADSTSRRRSRRKDHPRPERSHPIANCPIGRASGAGASRVRSRHAPALGMAQRQARLGSPCLEPEQPATARGPKLTRI